MNGNSAATCPTPAETARTIADISVEGTLCTLTADQQPLGTPVGYALDTEGTPIMSVAAASAEAANLNRSGRCSLLVQPISYPARGVASVALQGSAKEVEGSSQEGIVTFKLNVESCVYYGGLDHVSWPYGLSIERSGTAPHMHDVL